MINSTEIIKGCFFKNQTGKILEIYYFTIDNNQMNIWTRESYINANNEINYHQDLYSLKEIERIIVDSNWLEEFGFVKTRSNYYKLFKENKHIMSYCLEERKIQIKNNNVNFIWIKCEHVNKLQIIITLFTQIITHGN